MGNGQNVRGETFLIEDKFMADFPQLIVSTSNMINCFVMIKRTTPRFDWTSNHSGKNAYRSLQHNKHNNRFQPTVSIIKRAASTHE